MAFELATGWPAIRQYIGQFITPDLSLDDKRQRYLLLLALVGVDRDRIIDVAFQLDGLRLFEGDPSLPRPARSPEP